MLELDGSGGGGQLLRSALALSALEGRAVRMTGIRGARPEPGLKPQHLASVELLAAVCDADVSDCETGTTELEFRPGPVQPGSYTAAIGTAGSLALLFDAVLPLAAVLDAPLSVTATGGTEVKWSPTTAHYQGTKLRLLRAHGVGAVLERDRPGFYPVGGGRATLHLFPSAPAPLELTDRGASEGAGVRSLAAERLADASVAERQASTAVEGLEAAGIPVTSRSVGYAAADCPGSAVAVRLAYGNTVAGFDALGERGVPAEEVAGRAVDAATAFAGESAAVDRHTADQLLPFLAIAGGAISIPEVTDHVATARDLLERFGYDLSVSRDDGAAVVSADPP